VVEPPLGLGPDHPVRGDPTGDPPPPVGAIRVLGRFDVLAGHQRQQRHRLSRLPGEFLLEELPQQPVGVAEQRVEQLLAGNRSSQAIRGLPGWV
jgi:hypothetical protein